MGCSSSNSNLPDGVKHVEPTQNGGGGVAGDNSNLSKKAKTSKKAEEKAEKSNYPPSEAYVISFDDTNEQSSTTTTSDQNILTTTTWNATLADKTQKFSRPPARLQKVLEEHSNSSSFDEATTTATIETITEKLEKAELRRQAILQDKIEKAQKSMKMFDEMPGSNEPSVVDNSEMKKEHL